MMKRTRDSTSLMAIFLVLFLIVVGVTVWLLDFSSQQRVFGLLVSAELVAFAILAYFYYVDDPKDLNRKWITAGFVSMAAFILLAGALLAGIRCCSCSKCLSHDLFGRNFRFIIWVWKQCNLFDFARSNARVQGR